MHDQATPSPDDGERDDRLEALVSFAGLLLDSIEKDAQLGKRERADADERRAFEAGFACGFVTVPEALARSLAGTSGFDPDWTMPELWASLFARASAELDEQKQIYIDSALRRILRDEEDER